MRCQGGHWWAPPRGWETVGAGPSLGSNRWCVTRTHWQVQRLPSPGWSEEIWELRQSRITGVCASLHSLSRITAPPHSPYDRDSWFMAANHKCLHLRQHSLLSFTFFGGRTSSKIRKLHIPVRKSQVENEKLTCHSAHVVPASL